MVLWVEKKCVSSWYLVSELWIRFGMWRWFVKSWIWNVLWFCYFIAKENRFHMKILSHFYTGMCVSLRPWVPMALFALPSNTKQMLLVRIETHTGSRILRNWISNHIMTYSEQCFETWFRNEIDINTAAWRLEWALTSNKVTLRTILFAKEKERKRKRLRLRGYAMHWEQNNSNQCCFSAATAFPFVFRYLYKDLGDIIAMPLLFMLVL